MNIILDEAKAAFEAVMNDGSIQTEAEQIKNLALLGLLDYDRSREDAAKALGVSVGALDKAVAQERKSSSAEGIKFNDIEPWHAQIIPSLLLNEISNTVLRFIVCAKETADAIALWVALTWFIDVIGVAPLAVITAPEKRCGKSQLLFFLGKLVMRALTASNISPAALFRVIDAWKPTLLVDEADAFMKDNEELRGLLNCGHTRDSAYTVRIVGEAMTPTMFNVWGAKAIAGIGHLSDTLMDRAIVLELRRKMPHETTERLRHAEPHLFENLSAKLARFAQDYREQVRLARPELPNFLNDRGQDNWEPLLSIAQCAGEEWVSRATAAALKLSGCDNVSPSISNELLSDIQSVFESKQVERISTADLIAALCADEELSWNTYNRGKQLSPKQLSRRLKAYEISSKTLRIGYGTAKGFERVQFEDAFSRYLTVSPSPSVTASQPNRNKDFCVTGGEKVTVTESVNVTLEPNASKGCDAVTDRNTEPEKECEEVEL